MIGIIGDVHGRFEDMFKVIESYPDVTIWFQVGDLGGKGIHYPELPPNFYFIHGNHENWDALASMVGAHYLPNGTRRTFVDHDIYFTVAVLGGNYSPGFYTRERGGLCGDRRRHYVQKEVEALTSMEGATDILLTHEAPSPYLKFGDNIGQPTITAVIKHLDPDIHFFGHHHYDSTSEIEGILSIGVNYPGRSFYLYDVETKIPQFVSMQ